MTTKANINRLATGVPGLDEVLGGGLPELSFNLIAGQQQREHPHGRHPARFAEHAQAREPRRDAEEREHGTRHPGRRRSRGAEIRARAASRCRGRRRRQCAVPQVP